MGNGIDGNRLGVEVIARNADPYVDALLATNKWSLDASHIITYSFTAPRTSVFQLDSGPIQLNSNAVSASFSLSLAVNQVLASYAKVANVSFLQVPDNVASAGDIRITGSLTSFGNIAGLTILPVPSADFYGWGGNIFLSNNVVFNSSSGGAGYLTILHEIGHALGLKHPGNYNGDGTGTPPFFPNAALDTTAFSIMSYNNDARITGYPSTPGIADIKALQYLYGANMNAAPGDDVYSFRTFSPPTIWDPNGINTVSGRGNSSQIINLNEYSFSYQGSRIIGALALGTKISNAFGGIGDDQLIGNDLDNRLKGDEGNDQILGGGGVDTAVYSGVKARYAVSVSADRKTASVASLPGLAQDGVDQLTGVEVLQFADRAVVIDRSVLKPIGVSIADQLSVVYFGRGMGAEYRDGLAAQVANGPSADILGSMFSAAFNDGAFASSDSVQTIVNKTFLNIFGVQASAFEQNAWANTVSIGAVTREKLPWAMFVSYLGANNVPPSYQIPAQSRIIAANAFSNLVGDTADAKLGAPGATSAATGRSWLLSIRNQTDAAKKVATSDTDVNAILATNKFTTGGPVEDQAYADQNAPLYADPLDLAPLIGLT